ncbi:MAG: hypothetical protein H0W89_05370 [Candidatus Levybacteria bacterium]|nr:hypothetical protein [Candidatus Levybacteria bacterium]
MRTLNRKIRIIVRPWVPRKLPYQIPMARVKEVLQEAYPQLKTVVYVGWARRTMDNRKLLIYLAATGETGLEARKAFKKSEKFGEDIWVIQ